MNQEDILKMAREAGAGAMKTWNMRQESDPVTAYRFKEETMERFAALVAAKAAQDERFVCERICALEAAACSISGTKPGVGKAQALGRCIDAIRARGQ